MASIIKVDQIQSDSGTVNVSSNLQFSSGFTMLSPTLSSPTLTTPTTSGVMTLGAGIKFPATQVTDSDANTLDDYEEGLWTPTITGFSSGFSSVTYSAQQGKYVKIGRLVCCQGYVNWSSKSGGSGVFCISGLPFSTYDTGGTSVPNFQEYNGFTFTSRTQLGGEIFSNIIYFIASGTAVTPYSVAVSDVASSGYTYMWFSYMTT